MVNYFVRRLLLIIPTFLGSTVLVFTILQMAPGGPIEQMMLELQMGGAVAGEGGAESIPPLNPITALLKLHFLA